MRGEAAAPTASSALDAASALLKPTAAGSSTGIEQMQSSRVHIYMHIQSSSGTFACLGVCVHTDSKLRALVNVSDCKAGGRGTHTDSSANKAGLYAVRMSLRTLSDVPAYGNGNQAKPQTWQALGRGCMSLAANMLPGTCTVRAFRYTHLQQDLPRKV